MKFLNINSSNYNEKQSDNITLIDELNKSIRDGKNVFILFYMIGCGPCEATRPEWSKIQNVLEDKYKTNNDVLVVDIEHSLIDKINNLQDEPSAFPTIRYIKGKKNNEYQNNRKIDDFVDWIEGELKQNGGYKKNKSKKSKKSKKTKKTKKSKKTRMSKKTKKMR
jgi:thiol-disulfide isomerase/thioredoxin